MDGSSDIFTSSSMRPLQLRMRPDLVTQRHTYQGRAYWVIKDPVALKYHRFEEEEFSLLEMLDGQLSLDQIKRRFDRRFAPQRITHGELYRFVGMLYRSSLVVSESAGQGRQLKKRSDQNRRRQRLAAMGNVLSIRFKGFNPDRTLTWLNERIGWLFSRPAVLTSLALALSALLLVVVHFETFVARLPSFHEFFATKNWIWMALILGGTKILHEFGHGLACKRQGGECHEMGVMLLVLMPCLYCNVSDSWMLSSKWQRAAIGAAGMYVELLLASICTFLWWFSEPGFLNYMCLNVMFVCSVTTLLFNVNPLLRYDGYYILSDMLEIPNLRQKSTSILQRKLGKWLLGLPEPHDSFLPQRRKWLFALYAVAAAVYRWVVVLAILWFLNKVFEPYGLKILGQMIAAMSLFALVVLPLWQLAKFFHVPGRIEQVKKRRLLVSLAVTSGLLAAVVFIPLPHRVWCSLHIQPRDAQSVYVDVPGQLRVVHARAGNQVRQGDPLITLESLDLELEIAALEARFRQEEARRQNLERLALVGDESASLELRQVHESLASLDKQLSQRRQDSNRLKIAAPTSGTIVPPPNTPPELSDSDVLPRWSGTPLEIRNVGAYLSDGELVCRVVDPRRLEAILAIDQSEIEFIRPGQTVDIVLEQLPGRQFSGKINRISQVDMKYSPTTLSEKAGGDLLTKTDSGGRERPVNVTYEASVELDNPTGQILIGASGRARIHVGSKSLGQRLWRYLNETFNFDL
ncbi:MAG: HlyD family efflux transporter periplasmic adaptor subunit [Planctomycetes bacterium]|nr:HlyD family efflux transporter periplasmic adaptor subunit [Planctomycetota bacterium]